MAKPRSGVCTATGITGFGSSHLLSEVEQIASHVGVLQDGQLRFEGRLDELRARVQPKLTLRCDTPMRALEYLRTAGEDAAMTDQTTIAINLSSRTGGEINRMLVTHGFLVTHLSREAVSLESLFFSLTGAADLEDAA